MDYTKELLLVVATTLVSAGTALISTKTWEGVALLMIGAVVFIGRGFYKKYIS